MRWYKTWKFVYRVLWAGTTELHRLCRARTPVAAFSSGGLVAWLSRLLSSVLAVLWYRPRYSPLKTTDDTNTTETNITDTDTTNTTDTTAVPLMSVAAIEQCVFLSSKLSLQRRLLEARDIDLAAVFVAILRIKHFPNNASPRSNEARTLLFALRRIHATFALLHDLNARAATKYDTNNPAHEKKLLDLWSALCPDVSLVSRISSQWQQIGFQGNDPATDFRGMGLLGLDHLIFFSKRYPEQAADSLRISKHHESWFSWAIVGINITAWLLRLLRNRHLQIYLYYCMDLKQVECNSDFDELVTMQQKPRPGNASVDPLVKDAFHELYSYAFYHFARFWLQNMPQKPGDPPLTVMDFSRVFAAFQARIEAQLKAMDAPTEHEHPIVLWLHKSK